MQSTKLPAPVTTLRAQAKGEKVGKKKGDAVPEGDRARMDKSIVKAVLASPLIIPWPSIPNHLQKAVMNTLPSLIPTSIADYHLSRARCHVKDKRDRRKQKRSSNAENGSNGEDVNDVSQAMDVEATQVGNKRKTDEAEVNPEGQTSAAKDTLEAADNRQIKPEILDHLVLGINETIKSLERAIDDLKFTLLLMADALNGNASASQSTASRSRFLPTAPPTSSSLTRPSENETPLEWIIIPLQSINPQTLVSPIPQYCATYNALVYQHQQLGKAVKGRLKESEWAVMGEERAEVRVVPLGSVEGELAAMVGLRRLACLGVRASHPGIETLRKLLPKSTLQPPRHSLSIPYPIPNPVLTVHNGVPGFEASNSAKKPLPNVHYAPLHVKGITTTMPADNTARKKIRLEEVRKKRKARKESKKVEKAGREKQAGRDLAAELHTQNRRKKRNMASGQEAIPH